MTSADKEFIDHFSKLLEKQQFSFMPGNFIKTLDPNISISLLEFLQKAAMYGAHDVKIRVRMDTDEQQYTEWNCSIAFLVERLKAADELDTIKNI